MEQKHNRSPDLLFKIDVKIGQRIFTLNVNEGDTIEELLVKHKMGNQSNIQKFNLLKEKIKANIQKQMEIKIYSNQLQLANKMKTFLLKQNQSSNTQSQSKQFQKTQNRLNQRGFSSETHFKLLFEKNSTQAKEQSQVSRLMDQSKISDEKSSKNESTLEENALKDILVEKNQNNTLKQKGALSINSKKRKANHKQNSSYKKPIQNKVDEDLIKAYEVIWKKSKDKTMRQMAQNTLRELNVLPEEPKTNEFMSIDQKNLHEVHSAITENDDSIKAFTPIEKSEKERIFVKKSIKNDPISVSRSFMKRNYRYCYLQENSDLHYPYEKAQKSKEKFAYNCFDQTYINILNKDYDQKSDQKTYLNRQVNRRYSYLDN